MAFYEGLVSWGVFLWFCFFSREKEKLPGVIFNMLCMARRVNAMDGIHKWTRPGGRNQSKKPLH
ncbi:MAG: hypothetical protein ACN4GM_09635 [Gammaproteobacteria bacterium]